MHLTMLKAKIHRATVTDSNLEYQGSISIDREIMDAAGLLPFEQVDVYNITNGERLTTYVIEAGAGSGSFILNGAAARKAAKGDKIIVCAYCSLPAEQARNYNPALVFVDEENRIAGRA